MEISLPGCDWSFFGSFFLAIFCLCPFLFLFFVWFLVYDMCALTCLCRFYWYPRRDDCSFGKQRRRSLCVRQRAWHLTSVAGKVVCACSHAGGTIPTRLVCSPLESFLSNRLSLKYTFWLMEQINLWFLVFFHPLVRVVIVHKIQSWRCFAKALSFSVVAASPAPHFGAGKWTLCMC